MSNEQDYSPEGAMFFRSIFRMLRPHKVDGVSKIRVGRHFDGGYIMLDCFQDISVAYSLGINDEISWDLDIAQRGIEVYQYDHTINDIPLNILAFIGRRSGSQIK